jgi:hypothetical protein
MERTLTEEPDPEPHQTKKTDPDPHRRFADPQHGKKHNESAGKSTFIEK